MANPSNLLKSRLGVGRLALTRLNWFGAPGENLAFILDNGPNILRVSPMSPAGTAMLEKNTFSVEESLQTYRRTSRFTMIQSGTNPTQEVFPHVGQDVNFYDGDSSLSNTIFRGIIKKVIKQRVHRGPTSADLGANQPRIRWICEAVDYSTLLSKKLVRAVYGTSTVGAIVKDLVSRVVIEPPIYGVVALVDDPGTLPVGTYYYALTSLNAAGQSGTSSWAGSAFISGGRSARVGWIVQGTNITGYRVWRGTTVSPAANWPAATAYYAMTGHLGTVFLDTGGSAFTAATHPGTTNTATLFTTTGVRDVATIPSFVVDMLPVDQAVQELAERTYAFWRVEYNKDVTFDTALANPAPYSITDTSWNYDELTLEEDIAQIRSRVYPRGGKTLTGTNHYYAIGNGLTRAFPLPHQPLFAIVKIDEVSKTLGIDGVDVEANFDYLYTYRPSPAIRNSEQTSTITNGGTLHVIYQYYLDTTRPVENPLSAGTMALIEGYDGIYEHVAENQTLTDGGTDAAIGELLQFSQPVTRAEWQSWSRGWKPGDNVTINLTDRSINRKFIIQTVTKDMNTSRLNHRVTATTSQRDVLQQFFARLLLRTDRQTNETDAGRVNEAIPWPPLRYEYAGTGFL